jgi:large subunit ribosomal protein L29
MKASELREKNTDDLVQLKSELLKEQFNLRMQKGTGQLAKPHLLTLARKNIAKINTIITQKQQESGE